MTIHLLIDQNQSVALARSLAELGWRTEHVSKVAALGKRATDRQIVDYAVIQGMTVVTADTDFGEIVFRSRMSKPSVIRFDGHVEDAYNDVRKTQLLHEVLTAHAAAIEAGCLVVLSGLVRITMNRQ
ncbi:MAG: DUF5615 family PIN-like protein [Candidatus Nanopelagicales bacterium]|nr:DUF5615 family PIN-like protein [Candidatus Nanopelagicales bacterium]